MRAAVYERFGPPGVVELREVADPTPKDDELLVQVRATTVTSGDARLRALRMPPGFGLLGRLAVGVLGPRKRTLGVELSGVVLSVGRRVSRFRAGDEIFAMTGMRMGAHAELCVLPERGAIARKPGKLSFEEAAALPFGGMTAMDYLRRAALAPTERVLIVGASGAVGSAAVQLAKHEGAHVTAVCSAANAELARSLGADVVIDYERTDWLHAGQTYDVIMDTVGYVSFARAKASLARRGRLLLVVAGLGQMLGALLMRPWRERRVIAGPASERAEDLAALAELAERGVYRPLIDRTLPLADIAEAHARVDTGRKRGSIVIAIENSASSRASARSATRSRT